MKKCNIHYIEGDYSCFQMSIYEGRPTNSWTFCAVLKPYDLSYSNVHRLFLYDSRINLTPIALRL